MSAESADNLVKMPTAEAPGAAPTTAAESPPRNRGRIRRRVLLMVSLPLLLAIVGGYFWLTGGRYVTTDNAYVKQDKVTVSTEVSGRIVETTVNENDAVHAGDLLFRLDPEPYRIALAQSEASLEAARLQVEQLRTNYAQAESSLTAAEENLDFRQRAFDRQQDLVSKGVASHAAFDQEQNDLNTARQAVDQARQQVNAAAAALGGDPTVATDQHPAVRQAEAQRAKAALDLERTEVRAPADGLVSQTGHLQIGQYVTPATAVLTLVETRHSWVEANFKESDLTYMRIGQPATVTIDAYPGHEFQLTVSSIGAGTGSEFSLLPAENATGNWVKVVQRVPVEFSLDGAAGVEVPLRTGLSASVTVDTGHRRSPLSLFGSAEAAH